MQRSPDMLPLTVLAPRALSFSDQQAIALIGHEGATVGFVLGSDQVAQERAHLFAHASRVLELVMDLALIANDNPHRLTRNLPELWRVVWAGREAFEHLYQGADDE